VLYVTIAFAGRASLLIGYVPDLTPQATILYASESIADILEFCPEDIIGRSCFEYFRPDEIPAAENIYHRAVGSDKAAALYYAHIRRRDGQWVDCEFVFTVVYEVLVACTSIYKGKERNQGTLACLSSTHELRNDRPC